MEDIAALDVEAVCRSLHDLAVDIAATVFRGIEHRAKGLQHDAEWKALRADVLNLQHRLLSFIDAESIELEFMSLLFSSRRFEWIGQSMKMEPPPISKAELIALSLRTATECFEAADGAESEAVESALRSLALIAENERTPPIHKLLDLISAAKLLRDELSFDVIPFELCRLFGADSESPPLPGSERRSRSETESASFSEAQRRFLESVLEGDSSSFWARKEALLRFVELVSWSDDEEGRNRLRSLCFLAEFALDRMQALCGSKGSGEALQWLLSALRLHDELFSAEYAEWRAVPSMAPLLWSMCSKLMQSLSTWAHGGGGGGGGGGVGPKSKMSVLSHSLSTAPSAEICKVLDCSKRANCTDSHRRIMRSVVAINTDSEDTEVKTLSAMMLRLDAMPLIFMFFPHCFSVNLCISDHITRCHIH